jgi:hypothetical protein
MCKLESLAGPTPVLLGTSVTAGHSPLYCSRRRLLWELDGHAHCPVVGVCLPFDVLRRLADKVFGKSEAVDDYTLHCRVVSECKRRTPVAEAVKRDLDGRYAREIDQAGRNKTTEALAAWWNELSQGKDLAGAFWAALTHSRCTPELEKKVLGDVHMMQHQVGMARRASLQRMERLGEEKAELARAVASAQQRAARQADEHAIRHESQRMEIERLRGQLVVRDASIATLKARLDELEAALDRQGAGRRCQGCDAHAERIRQLERALQQSRREEERGRHQAEELAARLRRRPLPPQAEPEPVGSDGNSLDHLRDRAVLCVGGRTASVPQYRQLIERTGGRFLHHDGGEEHCVSRLDATLAAADLVICQTGCISHDAYWRVKDHCKRTGKRCVFVESPSKAGLKRALDALWPAGESADATKPPES